MRGLANVKMLNAYYLLKLLPKFVYSIYLRQFELDIRSSLPHYVLLLNFLKIHSLTQYNVLVDLVVYDNPGKIKRFTILYFLSSFRFNSRARVQIQTNEISTVFTVAQLFKNANWMEREVWDLFGIFFLVIEICVEF